MARLAEDLTYGYWPILKYTETPEGLMVYGRAAGPGMDLDKQGFDPDYLKTAVPDWYKWANVREQHQQIAAGVGRELEEKGNGEFWVKALVVDDNTIKKVKTGVLKGFSPGIRNGKIRKSALYPNGEICGGEMIELSLVDRPSDHRNGIMICKSAGGTLFLPTDAAGNELALDIGSVPVQWLTEDLYKSASAKALDVLNGELDDADAETAAKTITELADLQIAQLMMLKSADLVKGPIDISDLINAHNAMLAFIPEELPEGLEESFAELTKSATIDDSTIQDLVKAATADLTKAYDAKIEALVRTVEELRATPVSGGAPVVLPPRNAPQAIKPAETGIDFLAKAASMQSVDPAYAEELRKVAARKEVKTS